ncbi:hypothetical protein HDU76_004482 [Blyttiomyces sp. JEL0837]|nr:hypothetical protein HDU76_004482 [Blyttiomyces sp. JEL0837]
MIKKLIESNAVVRLKALKFHSKHSNVFNDTVLNSLITAAPALEYLELNGDDLTANALTPVAEKLGGHLQSLLIHHIQISNDTMKRMAKRCRSLRELTITDLQNVSGGSGKLRSLVSDPGLTLRLKKIELSSFSGFSDKDLAHIPANCPNLQWVDFNFSFTFPRTTTALAKFCPNLLYLRLCRTMKHGNLANGAVPALSQLSRVTVASNSTQNNAGSTGTASTRTVTGLTNVNSLTAAAGPSPTSSTAPGSTRPSIVRRPTLAGMVASPPSNTTAPMLRRPTSSNVALPTGSTTPTSPVQMQAQQTQASSSSSSSSSPVASPTSLTISASITAANASSPTGSCRSSTSSSPVNQASNIAQQQLPQSPSQSPSQPQNPESQSSSQPNSTSATTPQPSTTQPTRRPFRRNPNAPPPPFLCSSPESRAFLLLAQKYGRKIRVLDLVGNLGLSDYVLVSLSQLPNIHTLFLDNVDGISERGVLGFAEERWCTLKRLHVRNCKSVVLGVVGENFLAKGLEVDLVVDGGRVAGAARFVEE